MWRSFLKSILVGKSLIWGALFLMVSASVELRFWESFDLWSIRFIQSIHSETLDYFFASLFTYLGSPELTTLTVLLMAWILRKKYGLASALELVISFGLVTVIEVLAKCFLMQPGPPMEFDRKIFVLERFYIDTPGSYPSGHALRIFFVGLFLIRWARIQRWPLRHWFLPLIGVVMILMTMNRVYSGDHWLSDVIGSFFLAILGLSWIHLEKNEKVET